MIFFIIFNTFRLSYLPFAKYNICPILDVEHMHTRNQNCSLNFNQIESEWLKYLNYSLCFINFTCLQQNKLFLLGYYIFFFLSGDVWLQFGLKVPHIVNGKWWYSMDIVLLLSSYIVFLKYFFWNNSISTNNWSFKEGLHHFNIKNHKHGNKFVKFYIGYLLIRQAYVLLILKVCSSCFPL